MYFRFSIDANTLYVFFLLDRLTFTGTAGGISALCVIVELQQNFDKRRVLAFVILLSVTTTGNIASSYTMGILIETFGWRGTMLLNAAFALHTVASSLLLKIATTKQAKCHDVKVNQTTNGKTDEEIAATGNHGKQFLSTISLLCKDFDLSLFCIVRMLAGITGSSVVAHMSLRAVNIGMTLVEAMKIVTYVNVIFLISRPLATLMNLCHCNNNILITAVCAITSGLALSVSCTSDEYVVWMVSYTIFALLWGKLVVAFHWSYID